MLKDLLYKVKLKAVQGSTDVEVKSLHIDSRTVVNGGCFIAVNGAITDGHNYIYAFSHTYIDNFSLYQ